MLTILSIYKVRPRSLCGTRRGTGRGAMQRPRPTAGAAPPGATSTIGGPKEGGLNIGQQ